MTDRELLEQILQKISGIDSDVKDLKTDVTDLKSDVSELKTDVSGLKSNVSALKTDVSGLKSDVSELKTGYDTLNNTVTDMRLHIENITDRNLAILAENHGYLVDRMQKTIKSADRNILNEIKTNYLSEKVADLEIRITKLEEK